MSPNALLAFHQNVKLGKLPADKITPRVKLFDFAGLLPPAPAAVDYTGGVTEFGMMLNNSLGLCTEAAKGHALQTITLAATGKMVTVPDSVVLTAYENECGYVYGDESTDQGGNEVSVLDDWKADGFGGYQLAAYADIDPTNLEHVCQAINLLGGVYIGVQLPISAQGKTIWDVSTGADAQPGSWGGHAIWIPKYRTDLNGKKILSPISWGSLYDITQDFWLYSDPTAGPYIDEVHSLVLPVFVNSITGKSLGGFDLNALLDADAELSE